MRKLRWKNHLAQSHQASKLEHKPWFLYCQSPVFLTGRSPGVQVPGPLGESSSVWGWGGCWWVRDTIWLWRVQGWDPITRKLGTDYRLLWGGRGEMMVFCSLFHFLPGHPESSLRSVTRQGFRRTLRRKKIAFGCSFPFVMTLWNQSVLMWERKDTDFSWFGNCWFNVSVSFFRHFEWFGQHKCVHFHSD